jgi:hypothetical protein
LTTTTNTRAVPIPTAAPIPVPRMAPQRRWRPGLVALAVALVATGGLSAAYAITLVGSTKAYLAVSHEVQAGNQIKAADLTVVRISTDPALHPIESSQSSSVIGKYAATRLFPGTLVTKEQLTDVQIGGPGSNLVSIGLPRNRVPAPRIKPGAKITLVATPEQLSQTKQTGPPQTFSATVADISEVNQNGVIFVNVAVADTDSAAIATLAAQDRIAIVLAGG